MRRCSSACAWRRASSSCSRWRRAGPFSASIARATARCSWLRPICSSALPRAFCSRISLRFSAAAARSASAWASRRWRTCSASFAACTFASRCASRRWRWSASCCCCIVGRSAIRVIGLAPATPTSAFSCGSTVARIARASAADSSRSSSSVAGAPGVPGGGGGGIPVGGALACWSAALFASGGCVIGPMHSCASYFCLMSSMRCLCFCAIRRLWLTWPRAKSSAVRILRISGSILPVSSSVILLMAASFSSMHFVELRTGGSSRRTRARNPGSTRRARSKLCQLRLMMWRAMFSRPTASLCFCSATVRLRRASSRTTCASTASRIRSCPRCV
eukprot:comp4469_c0_seq1/m.3087 comp4469_c0_seq1/g.3087  ORF comp4469_c0_seq1/g.3087 comp4469_c0_seq1/m.3087 type:complete len:333 (+) comp4469_c0_seq1:2018-3016(+)